MLALCGQVAGCSAAAAQTATRAIIPRPASMTAGSGTFTLRERTTIMLATPDPRLTEVASLLREALAAGGVRAEVRYGLPRPGAIVLEAAGWYGRTGGAAADSEAYDLWVTREGVRMRAGSATGLVWAVQTFRQLLPPDFEATGPTGRDWAIPAVEIHDAPRFRWRGVLLDVGRHFFTVDEVKRQIDLYSRYKLNVFHWHLTEDQGWRIEIRRYPRLTEVGAWRTEADGSRTGGFYTQREVREVVDYARRRGVTVVPEIEMPGHSSAAIAAYPWLGCTNERITVPTTWGVFPDVYCVGKPDVLRFLENVLDEVVALFPGRYVHIGGDEVPKDRWRACAECQELMRREGLASEDELQSWFTRRIAGYLASKGRRLIGWDEITEGGLPPGVLVQVWRDMAHADSTARRGQDVIASPTSHVYLDYSQAGQSLARVHSFDPMPPGLPADAARHILGGEAPLWTERINSANLDLMAFPRLLALSEALWTSGPREFAEFQRRLDTDHYARLRAAGVVPGPEDRDVLRWSVVVDSATGRARFAVRRGVPDVLVRFTTDGTEPGPASSVYDDTTTFDAGTVIARAFVGERPMLEVRRLAFTSHLARGRPVTLGAPPAARYAGTGPRTLTDGLSGSLDFTDGLWQGWQGPDVEAVVDLGAVMPIATIEGSFLQNTRSWILLPRAMSVFLSDDGIAWRSAGEATHDVPAERLEPQRARLAVALAPGSRARFVKMVAANAGPLPAWHAGAGRQSWIFVDEIIIR